MTTITTARVGGVPRPRRTSPGRMLVHVIGELMITVGVVMLLLVVYQLFWTNIESNHKAHQVEKQLQQQWAQPPVKGPKVPGDAIGIMYIQRLGKTWEKPIVEGVDLDDLAKGVGHFLDAQEPGEVGNFAVAAHRATHGEPFAHLDSIQVGDKIVVETRTDWFTYTVDKMPGGNAQHPAWKLVDPNFGAVVLPVPEKPGAIPKKQEITLVTCNPRWGHTTRLIVYGHLTEDLKKSAGVKPAALNYFKG
jgi:sortase A